MLPADFEMKYDNDLKNLRFACEGRSLSGRRVAGLFYCGLGQSNIGALGRQKMKVTEKKKLVDIDIWELLFFLCLHMKRTPSKTALKKEGPPSKTTSQTKKAEPIQQIPKKTASPLKKNETVSTKKEKQAKKTVTTETRRRAFSVGDRGILKTAVNTILEFAPISGKDETYVPKDLPGDAELLKVFKQEGAIYSLFLSIFYIEFTSS